VFQGGRVVEQDQPPEWTQVTDCFFYVTMPIDNRELYVEFILAPDEPEEPGILIVSVHWPSK
jgi:hypothetical protein